MFAGHITLNCCFHKILLVADYSEFCFINEVIQALANEQWVSGVIVCLGDKMLLKIFENTFSGGDSRLQCHKYQKKNEL